MADPRAPSYGAGGGAALARLGSSGGAASEEARGAEAEAAQQAYFSELLSYSLERLSKEPELLRADQEHIRRQVEDTTAERYRAFISTAQCLADLRAELASASGSLDALARDLPKLAAASDAFRRDAAAANARRADNRLLYSERACGAGAGAGRGGAVYGGRGGGGVLLNVWAGRVQECMAGLWSSQCSVPSAAVKPPAVRAPAAPRAADTHPTLLELLEVPQLMDTCIRNGNYDEALDLRVRWLRQSARLVSAASRCLGACSSQPLCSRLARHPAFLP